MRITNHVYVLSGSYYAALDPELLGEIYGIQTDEGTDVILPGHGKVCLKNSTALLQLAARQAFTTLR